HLAGTGPSPPARSPSTSPTPTTRRFWPLPPRTDCSRSTARRCSSNRPWPNPRCSSAPPGHRSAMREPSCGNGSRRPCTPHSNTRARRPRTERSHAVETGVLHGMIIGVTVLIALATGLVVSRSAGAWIADPAHTAVFERSGAAGRVRTLVTGIAAVAAWFLPVGTVLSGATGQADAAQPPAAAPMPAGAVSAVSGSVDHIAAALILGTVAGATPFLIRVDVLVHRLPDRLVYPLIGF